MRLSVVIPTHNRKKLLREGLQALAHQDYPPDRCEAVVVDDGSDDGTEETLRHLETPFRLELHRQEQGGPGRARNAGLRLATGDVVVFMDDDIVPAPGFLAEHARYHERDEDAVVIGRLSPADDPRRRGWDRWEEQVLQKHFEALAEQRKKVVGRHVYSGNFSARRKHLLRVGGFDETMSRGEDIDLGYRLEQLGLRFYFNPRADGVHRGYRSYETWLRIPYQYGRVDVVLGRDKGYPGMLRKTLSAFHRRNPLVRLLVAMSLGRRSVSGPLLALLRWGALRGEALGLDRPSRYLYSGIANLLYWQGIADELGGSEVFWREVKAGC